MDEARAAGYAALDTECTQLKPPLVVQVAVPSKVYVFVATDRTGVRDSRLATLLAAEGIVKVVFGKGEVWAVVRVHVPGCGEGAGLFGTQWSWCRGK